jgi:DNA-binding transcriptional LysR family regulator
MKLTSIHAIPLAYFLEVAERGSLTAASQTLHVAISAISRQVARLESELGVPLFERDARGMRLTEAGAVVRDYANFAYLDAEAMRAELRGIQSLSESSVRLACSEGFAYDYLPGAIASFRQRYPGVRFSLDVVGPAEATRKVRAAEVDAALTFAIAAQPGIQVEHSEPAPVFALVGRHHPVASLRSVALADLMQWPLALPTDVNTVRQLFDLVCGLQGLRPDIVFSSSSIVAVMAYQRHADVVRFVGELAVRNVLRSARQVLVPLTNPELHGRLVQVQAMAGRRLPPAVRAFVDHLIEDIVGRRKKVRRR